MSFAEAWMASSQYEAVCGELCASSLEFFVLGFEFAQGRAFSLQLLRGREP